MKEPKSITTIVLQIITAFLLIGTKGWVIGHTVNYNNSFSEVSGYNSTLFETIDNYKSFVEYCKGSYSSVDYPNFPSFLIYLLFLLMIVLVVYSVLKLINKSLSALNYKVMCAVSGLALLITLYLMLLPFGHGSFAFYLKHDNPGVKFIILACMIATTLLIVLGERNSAVEMGGVGGKSISDLFPKRTKTPTNASNVEAASSVEKRDGSQPKESKDTTDWANTLIQYKALLDDGVITQEEFDKKKSELMR